MSEHEAVVCELHRPGRRNYPRRKFNVRGIDETWQADLVEMLPYEQENKGYKYLLTVIDTFSKYCWALPVKTKSAQDVATAMESILQQGYTPNWSAEIFTITRVVPTQPVTYHLKDYKNQPIAGGFYEHEIAKVKHPDIYFIEKVLKNQMYVKWLGFDSSHNSWIEGYEPQPSLSPVEYNQYYYSSSFKINLIFR
ncbi:hypothetical protein TKK_0011584 [Trichogramma kaykai]